MNIVLLTPGTGNFVCGNCIRDNALAHALRQLGHEVLMVPMYLPHVVDEPSAAGETPLFFGGINVYLQHKAPVLRRMPRWLGRLLDSRRLLRWAADRSSMTRPDELGELTVSMLRGADGTQRGELAKLVEWLQEHGPVDVVCLSNALLAGLAGPLRDRLGAKVICTLAGEDSFLDGLPEPYRTEAWDELAARCREVDGFIAVSRYYGDLMRARLGLPEDRVHVVYNGINLDGYEPAEPPPDPPVLGYLARMCPTKGLGTLIEAFVHLRQRDRVPGLKLKVAGAVTPADEPYVRQQRRRLADAGLAEDAEFLPNVDHETKQRTLRDMSVLSVPATYGESFGLYLLEAWASGVPVAQPRHGAFTELIEQVGGGILCEPDDPRALADAIEMLLLKHAESRKMADNARHRVRALFSVEAMAEGVAGVCEQLVHPAPAQPSS